MQTGWPDWVYDRDSGGCLEILESYPCCLAASNSAFWSIALFRWDINIRESPVLGLVSVGVALDNALNLLYWEQVAVLF